ncbi:MAG: adenosylmethionine--8-amino-7-oxononanoate transaminase [Flavobacteriales bacterium]|nr:adenosylmethionine--8-amino-7-oxononanoate transaminase [Flavobacteriales bacterium]
MKISPKDYPVWHPFSQMKDFNSIPKLVKGQGSWLWDEDGAAYLDAISSWWVTAHGHCNPVIANRIKEQLGQLEHTIFAGFTHDPAIELCNRITPHLPKSEWKYFFSDNGSTSVEVALKMAIHFYTQKENAKKITVFALEGAYHGDTFGAMSTGERGVFVEPFMDFLFDVVFLPTPTSDNKEELFQKFDQNKSNHNIFIFEPCIQGAAGMVFQEVDVVNDFLAFIKEHQTIVIADEVMTGFGRTGKWFGSNWFTTTPDILCLSKALTGGFLPMALTVAQQWLYDAFWDDEFTQGFLHGHSFTGNPIGCAAALGSMDLMEKEETWKSIERISNEHQDRVSRWQNHESFENVRSMGIVFALEVGNSGRQEYNHHIRKPLFEAFMDARLLIRPLGNTVYLLPPYCITNNELELCYSGIEEVIQEVLAEKV